MTQNNDKIAFLFLIYDEINHEDMWWDFFQKADASKYSIYIHYKEYKQSLRFDKYKLEYCVPTNYGDFSIVKAQKLLLSEAVKDEDNFKFVFLSNSCIPVKDFDYIYNKLIPDNYSYFDIAKTVPYVMDDYFLNMYVSQKDMYKASQWCILNREHTEFCVEDITYMYYFKNLFAPDEHYFIMICKNYIDKNIKNEATTFVNWDEPDDEDGCSPKTYYTITQENYDELKNSSYLFARKFDKNCVITQKLK